MKKRNLIKIIFLVGLVGVFLTGCGLDLNSGQSVDDKLTVATSIYPLSDIAANIGGEKINVVNILSAGSSPHMFELNPSDVKKISQAKILFSIGHGLDAWTNDVVNSAPDVEIFVVDEGIDLMEFGFEHGDEHEDEHENSVDGENKDPHYWLSADNAKIMAENVAAKLSLLTPENKEYYEANLAAYVKELDDVKKEITGKLAQIKSRKLIVFHESWNYFAREYDLEIVGVFESAPGIEPTVKYLKNLYDVAKEHNIKVVFSEPQLSPETIKPFVEDLKIKLFVLDPLGGLGDKNSLIKILKYNADTLYEALK